MLEKIKWLGHSSFYIEGDKIVYFDPWKIKKELPKADIVLISHNHYDHCSPEDVKKIIKKETIIVTNETTALNFSGIELKIVKPGDKITVYGIDIVIFPAYNIDKSFHPKSSNGLGFVITISGHRIYHCGDTDLIPEMNNIKCDIALLAVSGTYVMTASEATKAAEIIKPKIAIPMHYGEVVGNIEDAQKFVDLCKKLSIESKILDKVQI
ncbi:MAG: MBL fold metallo-hydrolase [Elusimicrobiota bacterium]|nr:MBL fold metallo-hydrolase [Elusimicrobiota bacterium]